MDPRPDDDAVLMLAFAAGDADAFTVLYARHRGTLYRFILRRVGDRQSADELFQETWNRVISGRSRYRQRTRFATWLLQIAHNLVVGTYRRAGPHAGASETEHVLDTVAAPGHEQPDRALAADGQRDRLQHALDELPDEQRTVFVLRMEQALGFKDIATITGVGRETVKSCQRHALDRIRQRLAE